MIIRPLLLILTCPFLVATGGIINSHPPTTTTHLRFTTNPRAGQGEKLHPIKGKKRGEDGRESVDDLGRGDDVGNQRDVGESKADAQWEEGRILRAQFSGNESDRREIEEVPTDNVLRKVEQVERERGERGRQKRFAATAKASGEMATNIGAPPKFTQVRPVFSHLK